ncbi:MAG: DNA methylase [Proteobacteria bacterium]|nr:DNA methylase [Pseudomonadota bacterium]
MARSKSDRQTGRLFRNASGQDELFEKSREEEFEARRGQPVECLGLTFENDEARRAHFLGRLKEGLEELHAKLGGIPFTSVDDAVARMMAVETWPMGKEARLRDLAERMRHAESSKNLLQRWKDEVGFPHGEIEDILNLSDPPYYTACSNPFLGEFVKAHGKPYDPDKPYSREPFAVDVSEGKTHPVYRAHAYHTKVPHLAIVPSILHYTEPGDLILDGFAGTGMTGVAAQWCGTAAESYRKSLETLWAKQGLGKPNWGLRYTIQNDLSPFASFIAANYNLPFDLDAFAKDGRALLDDVEKELGWMYETLHSDGETKGRIRYTVWSEVFSCPECAGEVVFLEVALDETSGKVRGTFPCPNCDVELNKDRLERVFESGVDAATGQLWKHVTFRPSLIRYTVDGRVFEKQPDADDRKLLRRIAELPLPSEVPTNRLPIEDMYHGSRLEPKGITHIHHFFLPRPTLALAALWRRADAHPDPRIRHMLLFFVEQAVWGMSILNRYSPTHFSQVNRQLSGVYYVASQHSEVSPWYILDGKLKRLVQAFRDLGLSENTGCIVTASTTTSLGIPNHTVDYIFTDPPFGENIYYADLNFLVESWHKVLTNAIPEAIVDRFKKKGLPEYQQLMQRCFEEYRRVLKPGRWITVVFHNSKNAVWTAIQEAMLAAGFVVADVRTMDKQQGSYRQVTSTAVKQDLIISAYKPNRGLEQRFKLENGTEKGAWDFIRTHLHQLPVFVLKDGRVEVINERQPYLLFDRMVAFHVLRNVTVPLSVGEFLAGLAQRFPERDGMVFLPDQVAVYDKKRMAAKEVAQLEIFVIDESSAIQWLRQQLSRKPQTFQEIHPQFIREIAGWQKHEKLPELSEMLEQNFLSYDGKGEIPSRVHSYLSTNFKELRNLPKDHPGLRAKAKDRWYVPDPNKAGDVEKRRERVLLREFEEYRQSPQKKLKLFRLEAVRAGFFKAYQDRDYRTIISVAEKIPEAVLQEDQKLMLWYDQALTRTGGDA